MRVTATDVSEASRVSARAELESRGIPFDERRFVSYVASGDISVVRLFLIAGVNPGARDSAGRPAVVLAAQRGHSNVADELLAAGAASGDLVEALNRKLAKRNPWEVLGSLSTVFTFVSSILIAGVGWHFTNSYNARQVDLATNQSARDAGIKQEQTRITEMDTVQKLIPYLTKDENSKRAALLTLSVLATPTLAARMGELFGGSGSVTALQTIAANAKPAEKPAAISALASIASRADSQGDVAAAATEALTGQFRGKERALLAIYSAGGTRCSGFVVEPNARIAVTASYCLDEASPKGGFVAKTWDDQILQVTPVSVTRSTGVAVLKLGGSSPLSKLDLSSDVPSLGSRMLAIGFAESSFAVIPGTLSGSNVHIQGQQGEFLTVTFEGKKKTLAGAGGGPILDVTGNAACMIYIGAADANLDHCVPAAAIRASALRSSY